MLKIGDRVEGINAFKDHGFGSVIKEMHDEYPLVKVKWDSPTLFETTHYAEKSGEIKLTDSLQIGDRVQPKKYAWGEREQGNVGTVEKFDGDEMVIVRWDHPLSYGDWTSEHYIRGSNDIELVCRPSKEFKIGDKVTIHPECVPNPRGCTDAVAWNAILRKDLVGIHTVTEVDCDSKYGDIRIDKRWSVPREACKLAGSTKPGDWCRTPSGIIHQVVDDGYSRLRKCPERKIRHNKALLPESLPHQFQVGDRVTVHPEWCPAEWEGESYWNGIKRSDLAMMSNVSINYIDGDNLRIMGYQVPAAACELVGDDNHIKERHTSLAIEYDKLMREHAALKQERYAAHTSLAIEYDKLMREHAALKQGNSVLLEDFARVQDEIAKLKAECKSLQDRCDLLIDENARSKEECEDFINATKTLEDEKEAAEANISALNETIACLRIRNEELEAYLQQWMDRAKTYPVEIVHKDGTILHKISIFILLVVIAYLVW